MNRLTLSLLLGTVKFKSYCGLLIEQNIAGAQFLHVAILGNLSIFGLDKYNLAFFSTFVPE